MWSSVAADVRPATLDDVVVALPDIRQADRDEIESAFGISMREAMEQAVTGSLSASAIVHDGKILALYGDAVHSILGQVGVPWLFSTVHVEQHPREFLRVCRPGVAGMLLRHRELINFVDARNTAAVRWLKWLGFQFQDAVPYGIQRLPFHPFTMNRD